MTEPTDSQSAPTVPDDIRLAEYYASFDVLCDVCATEEVEGGIFYIAKSKLWERDLYLRVDRYDSTTGKITGCVIPEGFTAWKITGDSSVSVLTLPGDGEPDTAFPKLRDICFDENTVYVTERDYFSPLADDDYCLYSAEDESAAVVPDWARNNQLTDLSGTYDGVWLLTTRPLGYMSAGGQEVRTGVITEYGAVRNTLTLCISRIDADMDALAQMAADVQNVFIKSVSVAPYRAGVAVTLELTEYAQSYTMTAHHVYSPEHEPDGQPEATYIEVRFSQNPGSFAD